MLALSAKALRADAIPGKSGRSVLRISTDTRRPAALRRREAYLARDADVPEGFLAYVFIGEKGAPTNQNDVAPTLILSPEMDYLADGDVIAVEPERKAVRVLYRRNSPSNSFLVTERCNHFCLMCSQPPRNVDDSWLIDEMLEAIPLISPDTQEIGFTGGEPTLLGDRFLDVLLTAKNYLPRTSLHILSNGRRFADASFTAKYAGLRHPDMMVGIPVYSDVSTIHDYVVQADGAFDETIRGILNLKRARQQVEIRVVIHKQTFERLPQLAEFIARNLTMVDHVALMGLEMMGFTRANLPALWIDPWEYRQQLDTAVATLAGHRMNVSVYNHQLCLIDRRIWPYARKSISDWKNEYMPECEGCSVREECGGFFSSAKHRYSDHISPVMESRAGAPAFLPSTTLVE